MKKFYVIALAIFLLGLGTVVFAADDGAPGAPGFGRFPAHHGPGAFLNLSKEQIDKMRAIRGSFLADTHDLRYDIREKRIEAKKLFTDPKADEGAIMAKHKELEGLVVRLMDRRAQMKLELRRVLTPEQITMLDRLPAHRAFMRRFHHFGPGQGPAWGRPDAG